MAKSNGYLQRIKDLKWCPGCGHWFLLSALNRALERLHLPRESIVIVTDIGCIGLADRFFNTNAFHGLHGRSVTYATGLKMARPELTVIVLMGDGGCGIGGTHIVNAARRNIGITLIVANNFNYGMTGCQQSVTTPLNGITETTPGGNIEAPLDVTALGMAGRAGWVGRVAASRENAEELEKKCYEAILHDGFSLLDAWEVCPGGYRKRNELPEEGLPGIMMECGFDKGTTCTDRPEFSKEYRRRIIEVEMDRPVTRVDLTPIFSSDLPKQVSIKVAGSAGQAIQSAVTMFGAGAILSGLYATQRNTYPITRQSGHSIAETIISPRNIEFTGMEIPDHLILLSEDGLRETGSLIGKMDAGQRVMAAESLKDSLPQTKARLHFIPSCSSTGLNKQSTVIVALTRLLSSGDIFPVEAWKEAIGKMSPEIYVGSVLKACEQGTSADHE